MPYLSILSADKDVILYRKELNTITGGVTSTILLQQISYWWVKSGRKPFYKFIEPCGHERYKPGDSWVEELGFSRKEFLTAIKRLESIGLICKKTNAARVTYYSLCEDSLVNALEGIYVNAERGFSKMPKGDLPIYTETTTETTHYSADKSAEAAIPAKAIHDLYNEICTRLPTSRGLSPKRRDQIQARWKEDPERQSLDWWRSFFEYINQSDFLANGLGSWKGANLEWVTNANNMVKIIEGQYENE